MRVDLENTAQALVVDVSAATAGCPNEASLRHELEAALERSCTALGLPWTPFRLDLALKGEEGQSRFADVAHGAVIIEYEAPHAFGAREGRVLRHARDQAHEYAVLLAREEGRPLEHYVLLVWDGACISFGRIADERPSWEALTPFDRTAAARILRHFAADGVPLVHPLLLAQLIGPETPTGRALIPRFYGAVRTAHGSRESSKTKLLFMEWRRLFGQVVGIQTTHLQALLARQGRDHGEAYEADPGAYLFALNTYIAFVAKVAAAFALPGASEDIGNPAVPVRGRVQVLESGDLFRGAGVTNMLNGDFFSWYVDDPRWEEFADPLQDLIAALAGTDFRMTRKTPESTRDLFKGLYQSFVPRALRHALGEFYTPDWLAAHALDSVGWTPQDPLTDPTCGSGTFLLEALRRRLLVCDEKAPAAELLCGLCGLDLNPLAVLTARASLVVFLSDRLHSDKPVRLPVFLADAVNPAFEEAGIHRHTLQTELGEFTFTIPKDLVALNGFFVIFGEVRELVEAELEPDHIMRVLRERGVLQALGQPSVSALAGTVAALTRLHRFGWNGIWCAILAERFAAAAIGASTFVCGNPPWVKWSHLPPDYAEFIKRRCLHLGVFSEDRWVGGIESDISTVVTYEAALRWLADGGILAFFITGTVFANESSQGFRRFRIGKPDVPLCVEYVEDFSDLSPFEGVSNHATLLVLKRGSVTQYPVPYRYCSPLDEPRAIARRRLESGDTFDSVVACEEVLAAPVPGTDSGPWLKGTSEQHRLWETLFARKTPAYRARKGVTTDANGVFFVRILEGAPDRATCLIQNDPKLGRRGGIPLVTAEVENKHLFPLLRGAGISAFTAAPDPEHHILVPQRSMHGDPELPIDSPGTYAFLKRFKAVLEARSSLKRFQRGQPFWSLWSTGAYSFAPYKVAWRELSGGRFAAALLRPRVDPVLGERIVMPDHKVYFVPLEDEQEGAYLVALLNAPQVASAISAYAAQLSLGASVVEYLALPRFDSLDRVHLELAAAGLHLSNGSSPPSPRELSRLDELALAAFRRDGGEESDPRTAPSQLDRTESHLLHGLDGATSG